VKVILFIDTVCAVQYEVDRGPVIGEAIGVSPVHIPEMIENH
jgi:hypothetical protein